MCFILEFYVFFTSICSTNVIQDLVDISCEIISIFEKYLKEYCSQEVKCEKKIKILAKCEKISNERFLENIINEILEIQ